jgi:hypothetical protein
MSATGYRPMSSLAIASAIAAVVALPAFFQVLFLPLAIVGIVTGGLAIRRIRRQEYHGMRYAMFGLFASSIILIAAPVWQYWLFQSEAPPGYTRVDYPAAARSRTLDRHVGQDICLKGYAYPGAQWVMKQFVLTVDGGTWNLKSPVVVTLNPGETWTFSLAPIAVSGTLTRRASKSEGVDCIYFLERPTVRPSRTSFGVSWRTSDGC